MKIVNTSKSIVESSTTSRHKNPVTRKVLRFPLVRTVVVDNGIDYYSTITKNMKLSCTMEIFEKLCKKYGTLLWIYYDKIRLL